MTAELDVSTKPEPTENTDPDVPTNEQWVRRFMLNHPHLSRQEEVDLINQGKSAELPEYWLQHAYKEAVRGHQRGWATHLFDLDDAFGTACLGLVISSKKVDPKKGRFSTKATPRIKAEIRRAFQLNISSVEIPVDTQLCVPDVEDYLIRRQHEDLPLDVPKMADWIYEQKLNRATEQAKREAAKNNIPFEAPHVVRPRENNVAGAIAASRLTRVSLEQTSPYSDQTTLVDIINNEDATDPEGSFLRKESLHELTETLYKLLPPKYADAVTTHFKLNGMTDEDMVAKYNLLPLGVQQTATHGLKLLKDNPEAVSLLAQMYNIKDVDTNPKGLP